MKRDSHRKYMNGALRTSVLSLKWIAAAISSTLFILLVFTSPFMEDVSALGGSSPLRPEWVKAGDYVTYLYSKTALGVTETIHIRETVQDDSGAYLNRLRVERFGEQTSPNFPLGSHLSPSAEEGVTDPYLAASEDQISSEKPAIEQVRGLNNNRTYEAYKFVYPVLYVLGEPCQCNMTVWYEKETLIRVKQLEWWLEEGIDVKAERIIEDSNIPKLAAPAELTTPSKTVITSTTTVYVKAPQTMITTTVVTTTTISVPTTLITTTTLTENATDSSTYAWALSATVATAVLALILFLKRRTTS